MERRGFLRALLGLAVAVPALTRGNIEPLKVAWAAVGEAARGPRWVSVGYRVLFGEKGSEAKIEGPVDVSALTPTAGDQPGFMVSLSGGDLLSGEPIPLINLNQSGKLSGKDIRSLAEGFQKVADAQKGKK